MFSEVYLITTNPKAKLSDFPLSKILLSVIFHCVVYTCFCNLVSYIFLGRILTTQVNVRLITALVVIMTFGFLARYYHVKDVYNAYNGDAVKTRNHLDKLYISWLFIS